MTNFSDFEILLMKRLINEANIHIRKPYPNPRVAAAIYKNETVISVGVHQKKTHDHAEVIAIKLAQESVKGASIMITLEPCTHHGSTPPCVNAIINSGINEVVFASRDPFSKVTDNPAEKILKQHNIDVRYGLLDKEAKKLNHDYFYAHSNKRPWVHLKAAMSLDAKIALSNNKSKYITGPESLKKVHLFRSQIAAIVIGHTTLQQDDPSLTIRYDYNIESNRPPAIIVIGSKIDITKHYKIFDSGFKTILVTSNNALSNKNTKFSEVWVQELKNSELNWDLFLKKCYESNVFSVFLEGGANLFSSAFKNNVVNQYSFFIAPKLIGDNQAISVVNFGKTESLDSVLDLSNATVESVGNDFLVSGYC
jgi:diaminohydroxyphosphoribosylaminopyrimidine deaminase / 5-amino-6-(5-phosphoribosylamino)uracil reductase